MQYYRNLCETCGGTLKKVDDSHYGCESCGNVYSIEKVENYVEKLTKLLDEAKLGMVSSARENLYKAITREHLSSEEICKWCDEIKKYLPDDFQANFYGAFDGSELQDVATMIRNINIEENFQCLELLLNFLIKSLESELVTDTLYLIERAYKLFSNNLEKYNKYSTLVSIEAQKLDDCIYETNYPRDVFVAYSSKDSNKALELVSELEAQGLSCFIALRNLRHGSGSKENYEKALREAMDSCTSFVFISSMNSRNQACDALKVEIPYIKRRDEQRAASVPFTTYANIPIEYKKPRVEYRLEESTRRLASDRIVDEFFVGYERVYTPIDVAERVMRQSEIVLAEPVAQVAPQVDIAKLVEEQLRAQREAEKRREEEEQRRIEEKIRKEEEEKRKIEEEKQRLEEEKLRKEAEEKEKCDLLYQEYLELVKSEKAVENRKNKRKSISANISLLKDKIADLENLRNNWESVELKISSLRANINDINSKIGQLNFEKDNLGIFANKRKKEIEDAIIDLQKQQSSIKREILSLEKGKQGYKSIAEVCDAIYNSEVELSLEKNTFNDFDLTDNQEQKNSKSIYDELTKYSYGKILIFDKGNHIDFGSYPQTEVKDMELVKTLNDKAGSLPEFKNSYNWISYDYYIRGNKSNFMWYIDVEHEGEKYRGVYFTSYRTCLATEKNHLDKTYQLRNGYDINTAYWFKYEPISWTILNKNKENQTLFVCCDMIIDSQEFDYNSLYGSFNNNYAESSIRKWLNKTFYDVAFNDKQKQSILTTSVDNSPTSAGYTSSKFACQNTEDKIFLLSQLEVINGNYGFSSDIARQKKTTSYAKAQGAYTYSGGSYDGNGYWILRSPVNGNPNESRGILSYGHPRGYDSVCNTSNGIVPALQIKL